MSKSEDKMVETVETKFLPPYTRPEKVPECACLCFSRRLRQRLADIRTFVVVMSLYILFYVSTEMYLMAVITTIEKRFGFNSYQSGMLFSAKEITFFCTVTFVSHFAKKSHRPRLIGLMGYIGALAGYVAALPHFMFGGGSQTSLTITDGQRSDDPKLCTEPVHTHNSTYETCDSNSGNFQIGAYAVFVLSAILLGLSQSCQGALSATYVDDSTTRDKMALYLGIISAMRPFGPMLGFLLGGLFTSFPEDFQDPGYGNADPRWVGAWWLGYIVCPTLYLIPCTLLIFFPKALTPPKGHPENETVKMAVVGNEKAKPQGLMGFLCSFRRLLDNPVYMIFLIASCMGAFVISGMFPFLPKYLETQFSMTAAKANLLLGSVATLLAGCGVFLGGLIQSRFQWKPHNSALYVFIINFIFFTIIGFLMFVGCEQTPIYGVQKWMPEMNTSVDLSCVCGDEFFPVCGSDAITYRSPCHAGCTALENKTYTGCSVISIGSIAKQSQCQTFCVWEVIYVVMLSLAALVSMTGGIPGYIVIMRSVDETDKSIALGFLGTAVSLVSFVPGPIVFGALVDSSCLLWRHSCGGEGACSLYDSEKFRYRLHGTTAILIGASDVLCGVVTLLLWKRHKRAAAQQNVNVVEIGTEVLPDKPPQLSTL